MPPRQKNLDRATEIAFEAVVRQGDEQMLWLGAKRSASVWQLPVLNQTLDVDLARRALTTSAGRKVGPHWTILALHYLATGSRPQDRPPEITFADLETARSYAGVYHARVIARLCATAGREAETLRAAAEALGGRDAQGGDAAFDFHVFPRLPLRLIWHAPDDEFPASATMLLPASVEAYFCAEDIVVLSELLIARLGGRSF